MELKEMKDYMYNCVQMSFNYGRHCRHLKNQKKQNFMEGFKSKAYFKQISTFKTKHGISFKLRKYVPFL